MPADCALDVVASGVSGAVDVPLVVTALELHSEDEPEYRGVAQAGRRAEQGSCLLGRQGGGPRESTRGVA